MKVYKGQPIRYVQEKMNGMSVTIKRLNNGELQVSTRTPGVNLAVDILNCVQFTTIIGNLYPTSTVHAELYWDGHSTAIKTLLKDRDPRLKISAFACPLWRGKDLSDHCLIDVMGLLHTYDWQTAKIHNVYDQLTVVDRDFWLYEATRLGLEGFVLKTAHMGDWYKLKPVKEMDCVVISTKKSWATTTFGDLKAVVVGVYKNDLLREIASVGTGFTQEFRASVDRQSLIGRVCEIEYQDIAQQGRLLFPRFIRWRDDKPAEQCTID